MVYVTMTVIPSETSSIKILPKILLGVVLPLVLFVVSTGLLFLIESSKGPDWGIVATVKLWIVYIPGIPGIVVMNSLLMTARWKSVQAVCSVGLILPAILVVLEFCILAFMK
jgi:hypothetical protein